VIVAGRRRCGVTSHEVRYAYYPVYDNRAVVRVIATPKDAAVYVDGYYAGTVHDFNDWFEGLPLPPGGHEIWLFLDGYRTTRDRVYLSAGSTFKVRHAMERLPVGEASERPAVAAPIPPPPDGTFIPPRTQRPPAAPVASAEQPPATLVFGTLSLVVQPASADVAIDGDIWTSADGKTFVVQVPAGTHRIAVTKTGYKTYSAEVEIREGETKRLNVALTAERTSTATQR
jgi:PEGA domain